MAFFVTAFGPLLMIAACIAMGRFRPAPTQGHLLDFRPVLRNRSAFAYSLAYCVHTLEMNALRGWEAGELFASDERWDPDALLQELVARFPDGASPPGMLECMRRAGGRSLQDS